MGMNVIGEGIDIFGIPLVVLKGNFRLNAVLGALHINHFMDGFLLAVQELHKLGDTALVVEAVLDA
ncbi:hypothetical protein D3C75_1381020 [compost metagenome]